MCIQYFVEIFRTYCRQNPSYSVEGGTIVPMDLEELYDKVYRYCYMKLRHPQAAEDMTQEAFLRFLRVYEEREIKKRTAYLYTIARNLCTDFCRARQTVPLEQAEQIPPRTGMSCKPSASPGAGPGAAARGGAGADFSAVYQRDARCGDR